MNSIEPNANLEIDKLYGEIIFDKKTQIWYYEINSDSGKFYRKETQHTFDTTLNDDGSPVKHTKKMPDYIAAWFSPNSLDMYDGDQFISKIKKNKTVKLIALDISQPTIFNALTGKRMNDYLSNKTISDMISPRMIDDLKNEMKKENRTIIDIFTQIFPYGESGDFLKTGHRESIGMFDRLINAILSLEFPDFNGYATKQLRNKSNGPRGDSNFHAEFTINNYSKFIDIQTVVHEAPTRPQRPKRPEPTEHPERPERPERPKRPKRLYTSSSPKHSPTNGTFPSFNPQFLAMNLGSPGPGPSPTSYSSPTSSPTSYSSPSLLKTRAGARLKTKKVRQYNFSNKGQGKNTKKRKNKRQKTIKKRGGRKSKKVTRRM